MKDVKHDRRLPEASDAGQKPPTEANPTRQRYQLGCPAEGASIETTTSTSSRQPSRSPNRGSQRRG